jgi:hypothetical protein
LNNANLWIRRNIRRFLYTAQDFRSLEMAVAAKFPLNDFRLEGHAQWSADCIAPSQSDGARAFCHYTKTKSPAGVSSGG